MPPDSLIFLRSLLAGDQGPRDFSRRDASRDRRRPRLCRSTASLDTNIGKGVARRHDAQRRVRRPIVLARWRFAILEGAAVRRHSHRSARPVRPIFDWRQLQRWGINESLLPPDAEIRFRVPTVWELYGAYIIATVLVVVIAQLLLITGLLRTACAAAPRRQHDPSERGIAAHQLRAHQAHGRPSPQRPGSGARRHRARSARRCLPEAGVRLDGRQYPQERRPATSRVRRRSRSFEELERETRNTFEGIRRLSHDLHPATLRLLGLAPALRSHCDEIAKRQGVEVPFSVGENFGAVHPDVAVCFFRIAQESMRNSIAHGGAKHLTVTLTRAEVNSSWR